MPLSNRQGLDLHPGEGRTVGRGPGNRPEYEGAAVELMGIGEFARQSGLSPKALRLYDELGLLAPACVDRESGYRWYDEGQLAGARLVAALRQVGMPLAQIKAVTSADPGTAAGLISSYWTAVESEHEARRKLAAYLVDQLTGKGSIMYDVQVRDVPARSVLCLLRATPDWDAAWALGKEFMGIMRRSNLPRVDGTAGAAFCIYHGEVSADSDGPLEWCRPVPEDQAAELAARVPELTLRTEPAHQEAFVHLGQQDISPAQWELVSQSLRDWADARHRQGSELGPRITYMAIPPITPESRPDCDFAVPLGDRAPVE
jgi:DNA-binding transcriptional MerR regulator